MLEFFRTYQKSFFLLVTIVVISSFVFFGTSSALMDTHEIKDREIGKAIDGSSVKYLEISALEQLLHSDVEDLYFGSKQSTLNLLNDGVIRNDFIHSGIADVLIENNFDLLKGDLGVKREKILKYKGYQHPIISSISSFEILKQFAPEFYAEISALQKSEELGPQFAKSLLSAYRLQKSMPTEWLRRILLMHEQQYKKMAPDPRLKTSDLSVFGFTNLTDWFGKNFIDLTCEMIYNGAIEAEKKGFKVSYDEAKADLRKNFATTYQKLKEAKWPVELTYQDQLRILGLDEKSAVNSWKKVLLFRRYFDTVGKSAILDRLPFQEYAVVAKEKAAVEQYRWHPSLKMKNDLDRLSLHLYLKATSPEDENGCFPTSYFEVQRVEKNAPELVSTRYKAKVIAVDKREIALKAPLRLVWDTEGKDEVWNLLQKEFSSLKNITALTAEDRLRALDKIQSEERIKIDFFVRRYLVRSYPEWIEESLKSANGKEMEISISDGKVDLSYIDNPKDLASLFQKILTAPESVLSQLQCYETNDAFFRFDNIEKISNKEIKTFEIALKDGTMDRMIQKELETQFPKLRMKLPPEKSVKELSDVKEEIASLILNKNQKERILQVSNKAKSALEKNPVDERWVRSEKDEPYLSQFKLERIEKELTRTSEDWMSHESFIIPMNTWSPVHSFPDGNVTFFYLKNRYSENVPILEQINASQEILAKDAKKVLAEKLLACMKKNQCIVIPLQKEQE